MTAGDVTAAIRKQNRQVAAGRLGQPPTPAGQDFQLTLNTLGRLESEEQFREIVVKTDNDGSLTYLKDVVADDRTEPERRRAGRQELRRQQLPRRPAVDHPGHLPAARLQRPGHRQGHPREDEASCAQDFPRAAMHDYKIVYDTTVFIDESIHEVYKTLFEAFVLVFIVVLVFLQDWRATLLPMIAVPVSLIGTFAVMALLGFSLNNLSLFGLVLAIGIVVDDAIVVVENVERWMAKGLPPREATIKAMDEITGPGDRHHPGAVRGVHPDRVHGRHQRPVLQAVRPDHRRLDDHLGVQRHDDGPGPGRDAHQAALHGPRPESARPCRAWRVALLGGARRCTSSLASRSARVLGLAPSAATTAEAGTPANPCGPVGRALRRLPRPAPSPGWFLSPVGQPRSCSASSTASTGSSTG